MKKHNKRIYIIFIIISFIAIFITTSMLPAKNSSNNLIDNNIYIVVSEIFIFLFLIFLFITSFFKLSFTNILKNAILPTVIICTMILANIFGRLNILMDITIPLAGIVLFILLSIQ